MLQHAQALCHSVIQAPDGIAGRLDQVAFDEITWRVRYLVVRLGGWLVRRRVLLPPGDVSWFSPLSRALYVSHPCRQIAAQPDVSADPPVADQQQIRALEGMPPAIYGGEPGLWASALYAHAVLANERPAPSHSAWNRHLHGTGDVQGYAVAAQDTTFGQVDGLILDDSTWRVAYLVIRTDPWFWAKRVAIETRYVRGFDWASELVCVTLPRADIEACPTIQERLRSQAAAQARPRLR